MVYAQSQTYSSSQRIKNFCLKNTIPDNLGLVKTYLHHTSSMLKIRIRTSLSALTNVSPQDYPSLVYFGIR